MKNISYYLLIICLIFSPLAFGSVETWALLSMEVLITVSAIFYALYLIKEKKNLYSVPGLIPLIILCEFILIQIIPLPQSLVKIISPSSWELYNSTVGVFKDIQFMTISVNKSETLSEFIRYSVYVIFYSFSVQIFSDRNILKSNVKTISVFGFLLAFSSICQLFLRKDYALWFRYVPDNSMIVGPYICHNHYAGLMEMIFPLSLVLYIYNKPTFIYGSIKERFLDSLNSKRMMISLRYAFYALTIALSIFLSLSRGGIISLCAGTVFFFVFFNFYRSYKKTALFFPLSALILITLAISWFGWDDITGRFYDIKNEIEGNGYSRLAIWKDSFPIFKDFILTGSGFGTFRWIFPSHQSFPGTRIVDHTHNDYLEFATTSGLIGIVLTALFIVSVVISSYRVFVKRKDRYSMLIFSAALSGMVSIFIHSIFDFNMQIPANALYFFMLCSILVAGSASRSQKSSDSSTYLEEAGKYSSVILLFSSLILLVSAIFVHGRAAMADYAFSEISKINIDEKTDKTTLKNLYGITLSSLKTYPLDSKYSLSAAKINYLSGNVEESLEYFKKAIALNPADSDILLRAALLYNEIGQRERGGKLLAAAVKYNATGYEEHMVYAKYLMNSGKKNESLYITKKMLSFYTGNTDKLIENLESNLGLTLDEIYSLIPEKSACFAGLGVIANKRQLKDLAEKAFIKTQECEDALAGSFLKAAEFFSNNEKNHAALQALKTAEEKFPDDIRIMDMTARLYENLGVTYRANEEYRKILLVDPSNLKARKMLGY